MKRYERIVALVAVCFVLSTLVIGAYAEEGQNLGAVSESVEPFSAVELALFKTYTGCGYVVAGIGVRNTGRGTISVRLPSESTIVDAWLYWLTLDSDPPKGINNIIMVGGGQVIGTLIAKGPDPCWGPATVTTGYTYRARVNSQLSSAGDTNGGEFGISVGGMATYSGAGQDPWDNIPSANSSRPLPECVALVLVYSGGKVPAGSIVQIFDGYFMQAGGSATFTYNWPARPTGGARFSHVTADGQANASPFTKYVDFAGTIIDQPVFNGYDPSIRTKATHSGSLADTNTYNVGSLVPVAGGAKTITWNCQSDCISFGALIFWTATDNPN